MRQRIKSVAWVGIAAVSLLVLPIETLAASDPICKALLSEAEVIGIANNAATLAGIALRDFHTPVARLRPDANAKICTWSVYYNGRKPTLGNHFWVLVEDQTKRTTFIPGE